LFSSINLLLRFRSIWRRQLSQPKQIGDVTVAIVTSPSPLFETHKAVRGKVFFFWGGGDRGKRKSSMCYELKWQEERQFKMGMCDAACADLGDKLPHG
jgi:hypothetical protein